MRVSSLGVQVLVLELWMEFRVWVSGPEMITSSKAWHGLGSRTWLGEFFGRSLGVWELRFQDGQALRAHRVLTAICLGASGQGCPKIS